MNDTPDNNEAEDPLERLAFLIEKENYVSEEFITLMQSTPKHEVSWIVLIETLIFINFFLQMSTRTVAKSIYSLLQYAIKHDSAAHVGALLAHGQVFCSVVLKFHYFSGSTLLPSRTVKVTSSGNHC